MRGRVERSSLVIPSSAAVDLLLDNSGSAVLLSRNLLLEKLDLVLLLRDEIAIVECLRAAASSWLLESAVTTLTAAAHGVGVFKR